MDTELARAQMVKQQVRAWDVLDPRVLDLLDVLPRDQFVPPAYRKLAYADMQIPLAHGEVMMAPKVEGRLLQALDPQADETALEIGTGSGFVTACLARLAGEVLSLDIHADFTAAAGRLLADLGIRNATLETRDATRLDGVTRRFDLIAVTGSLPAYDARYAERLNVGGRLFVIAGQPPIMEALLITRVTEAAWARESLFETSLPPLVNAPMPAAFHF
ncbi:MAG: protein-L-isoaspartate O-methyltransferase [Gammaproteobacteria bacterium]|nr:protein-L-isoaspartate O-methyltransferase [Gammaproteobacteria bacterium]MDE2070781.1 protein-L-isoaspartate O-methyltransferase [Gammaproteobacteria bacterium]